MATDIKHFFLLRMAVTAWYILSRQKNVNFNQAQLQKALATDRIKKSVEWKKKTFTIEFHFRYTELFLCP